MDQLLTLLRRPGPVFEAESPEEDHGLSLVVQVARILADLDLVAKELPVVDDRRGRSAPPHREVEHHRPDASLAVATLTHIGKNRIDVPAAGGTGRLGDEAAQEDAVDPILPHPLGMQQHGPFPHAAVESSW